MDFNEFMNMFMGSDKPKTWVDDMKFFVEKKNEYSMEELRDGYMKICIQLMETMLDLENLEHAIIAEKGEEEGNEFLERVATSPAHMYSFEEAKKYHDYRDQIEALLETLKLNHIIIESPDSSDTDNDEE